MSGEQSYVLTNNNNKYCTNGAARARVLQARRANIAHGGFTERIGGSLRVPSTSESGRVSKQQLGYKWMAADPATASSLIARKRHPRRVRPAGPAIMGHEAAAGAAYTPAAAAALDPAHAVAALLRQSSAA